MLTWRLMTLYSNKSQMLRLLQVKKFLKNLMKPSSEVKRVANVFLTTKNHSQDLSVPEGPM